MVYASVVRQVARVVRVQGALVAVRYAKGVELVVPGSTVLLRRSAHVPVADVLVLVGRAMG